MDFKIKYMKYKQKYVALKHQTGGNLNRETFKSIVNSIYTDISQFAGLSGDRDIIINAITDFILASTFEDLQQIMRNLGVTNIHAITHEFPAALTGSAERIRPNLSLIAKIIAFKARHFSVEFRSERITLLNISNPIILIYLSINPLASIGFSNLNMTVALRETSELIKQLITNKIINSTEHATLERIIGERQAIEWRRASGAIQRMGTPSSQPSIRQPQDPGKIDLSIFRRI